MNKKQNYFSRQILVTALFLLSAASTFAMQIFVTMPNKQVLSLEVEGGTSIEEVKSDIQEKKGIHPDCQILSFNNIVFQEGNTLSEYNIQKESMIFLQIKVSAFKSTIADAQVGINTPFTVTIPDNVFTVAPDGLIALKSDGTPLPTWLNFDFATKSFVGTATQAETVEIKLQIVNNCEPAIAPTTTFSIRSNVTTKLDLAKKDPAVSVLKLIDNKLIFDTSKADNVRYLIYNNAGKLLKSGKKKAHSVDVADLNNGLYFVRLLTNETNEGFKFIKR